MSFEWYATGQYSLRRLAEYLFYLGLRNRDGGRVTLGGLSVILRNPFYMGYMHLQKQNRLFQGAHEPIISKEMFFRVQDRLKSRVSPRPLKHRFKYSRKFKCASCGRSLVGSERKGHIYYRCPTVTCPTVSIREDRLDLHLANTSRLLGIIGQLDKHLLFVA
jgi:hypothetical protein